ncbi:NUDIX hydrolase [Dictyobacter aurantiacus]|uniref:DNA mismatch repair protein MutT n=1 Tax=Dictyobacter aurantiacus TaxID=1936993 RepID=A0A401ZCK0_9CHLR|nr:NUDIX domain-containing protein [Dictyobacter aurantiacus]GCE04621.1 DNA mismatch repair protein MutT [Dictyobacter aurantiacus]
MTITDNPRTMIKFKTPSHKFTYRVGGIAIHEGRVLCQKATLDPRGVFWFLPGGRAELGESSQETLRREIQEELGEQAHIGGLLYVVENFFSDGIDHHEISLYFELAFPPDSYLYQQAGPFEQPEEMENQPLIFDWLPLADLPHQLWIRPHFFCTALQSLPAHTQHIILPDGVSPR